MERRPSIPQVALRTQHALQDASRLQDTMMCLMTCPWVGAPLTPHCRHRDICTSSVCCYINCNFVHSYGTQLGFHVLFLDALFGAATHCQHCRNEFPPPNSAQGAVRAQHAGVRLQQWPVLHPAHARGPGPAGPPRGARGERERLGPGYLQRGTHRLQCIPIMQRKGCFFGSQQIAVVSLLPSQCRALCVAGEQPSAAIEAYTMLSAPPRCVHKCVNNCACKCQLLAPGHLLPQPTGLHGPAREEACAGLPAVHEFQGARCACLSLLMSKPCSPPSP